MSARYLPTKPAAGGGWVALENGERLYIQADAKTAPAVTWQNDGAARADVHNAFVLPVGPLEMGGACDSTTEACRICYAAGSENLSPSLGRNASSNLETLRRLYGNGGRAGMARVVAALVAVVEHSAQQQRARGVDRPLFRWHSGGDLFALWYARAIRRAVEQSGGVDHWLYTRDASNVRGLLPTPANLRVYLSVDEYNVERMGRASNRLGLPCAVLADDDAHAASIWARLAARGVDTSRLLSCPATDRWTRDDLGPAYIVGPDGRRASLVRGGPAAGACAACAACLPSSSGRGITFLTHGGSTVTGAGGRLAAAVRRRIPVTVVS